MVHEYRYINLHEHIHTHSHTHIEIHTQIHKCIYKHRDTQMSTQVYVHRNTNTAIDTNTGMYRQAHTGIKHIQNPDSPVYSDRNSTT
jgi:hypothetical protein